MIMRKQLQLSAVIVWAILLISCAVGPKHEATVRSPNEGALVSGWMQVLPLLKVILVGVDGLGRRGWHARTTEAALIDPGGRILNVHGEYLGLFYVGYADVELKADLQAGQAYQLRIERNGRLLTFWLEDATTHSEVSDRQAKEASIRVIVGGPGGIF
jgi:hypothetical protein